MNTWGIPANRLANRAGDSVVQVRWEPMDFEGQETQEVPQREGMEARNITYSYLMVKRPSLMKGNLCYKVT